MKIKTFILELGGLLCVSDVEYIGNVEINESKDRWFFRIATHNHTYVYGSDIENKVLQKRDILIDLWRSG